MIAKELELQNKKNLNIGIPSSISPRNSKNNDNNSYKTDSEQGEAVIIDENNIKLNSPNLSSQQLQTRQAKRAEAQK